MNRDDKPEEWILHVVVVVTAVLSDTERPTDRTVVVRARDGLGP